MRTYSVAFPIGLLAASLVSLSGPQKAALDAAAVKACRTHINDEYPSPQQIKPVGRIRTFGGDSDHDVHYGVIMQVVGADRWVCLYDRDANTVSGAGIVSDGP